VLLGVREREKENNTLFPPPFLFSKIISRVVALKNF